MKYTPKPDEEGVNYSLESPLKNFLYLVSTVMVGVILLIAILSLTGSYLFTLMSPELEEKLFSKIDFFGEKTQDFDEGNKVLGKLIGAKATGFQVKVWCSDQVNAVAVPGKKIFISNSLLEKMNSENELALILGHEYGHFLNRDHLRSMGSGLVVSLALSVIGQEVYEIPLVDFTTKLLRRKFGRSQEEAADDVAQELLVNTYGNTISASRIFDVLAESERHVYLAEPELLNDHPDTIGRRDKLLNREKRPEKIIPKKYEKFCN